MSDRLEAVHGEVVVKDFDELSVEDFTQLSAGRVVGRQSWAFRVSFSARAHDLRPIELRIKAYSPSDATRGLEGRNSRRPA